MYTDLIWMRIKQDLAVGIKSNFLQMSDPKTVGLPQASTNLAVGSYRVEALVTSAGPADSGGGQAHRTPTKKLDFGDFNPFKKRSSLSRTPPEVSRTAVVKLGPNTEVDVILKGFTDDDLGKRKRHNRVDPRELEKNINTLTSLVKKLAGLVKESSTTKREIKDTTEALTNVSYKLKKDKISAFFDEVALTNSPDKDLKIPRQESKKCSRDTQTDIPKTMATVGTQTMVWNRVAKTEIIKDIGDISDYQSFTEIEEKKWEEAIFKNVDLKVGNPLGTDWKVVKCTLVEPQDKKMEFSIQRLYRDRYPMLADVARDFEILEQRISRKSKEEGEQVHTQKIIRIKHDNSGEVIWNRLRKLKEECKEDEVVAIHHLEKWPEEKLRKMTQAIFNNSRTKAEIYTTAKRREAEKKKSKTAWPAKREKTLALVVEREGRDYKEVLKDVREAVNDKTINEHIQTLRSTKEDKLLIVLDKDPKARDEVKKLVESRQLKVRQLGQKNKTETIYLRGLDALATRDDVVEALNDAVGKDKVTKVGPLRPHIQETQAVTVIMNKEVADELVRKQTLRVGTVCCVVEKRLRVKQCSKCWSYEHTTSVCTGPDRSKMCKTCGEEGHVARDCKAKDSRCMLCDGAEHLLGTGRCKAFYRALIRTRQRSHNKFRAKSTVEEKELTEECEMEEDVFHPSESN